MRSKRGGTTQHLRQRHCHSTSNYFVPRDNTGTGCVRREGSKYWNNHKTVCCLLLVACCYELLTSSTRRCSVSVSCCCLSTRLCGCARSRACASSSYGGGYAEKSGNSRTHRHYGVESEEKSVKMLEVTDKLTAKPVEQVNQDLVVASILTSSHSLL
jgi:hypothetical protein